MARLCSTPAAASKISGEYHDHNARNTQSASASQSDSCRRKVQSTVYLHGHVQRPSRSRAARVLITTRRKKQTHASLYLDAVCRPEPFRLFIFKLSVRVPSQLIAATVTAPLGIFLQRLKVRLKPNLRDEGRNDGTADNSRQQDRVLRLIDDVVGEAEQRRD